MQINQRLVITVDGLAGSGKTTLSKLLAQKLNFAHLNSGLLYRTVALLLKQEGVESQNIEAVLGLIKSRRVELVLDKQKASRALLDGKDMTEKVFTPEISELSSKIAALSEVREALISNQRNAFPGHNLVAEGRDMGTVIFLDSPLKFFIEVDEKVRKLRRLKQLGYDNSEDKTLIKRLEIELEERDKRDTERTVAPTKPALGAIVIDNSVLSLTEVIENMYDAVLKQLGNL